MKRQSSLALASVVLASWSSFAYSEPVKLMSLDWTSQQVLTKVLGNLLQQKNVDVEYVFTDARSQWYKLAHDQGDVQVEVWEGSMAAKYQQLLESGHITEGTTHKAKTREDWWYPDYAEAT